MQPSIKVVGSMVTKVTCENIKATIANSITTGGHGVTGIEAAVVPVGRVGGDEQ